MSCGRPGCVDGLITVFDADGTERARKCVCQVGADPDFKRKYRPGGKKAKQLPPWRQFAPSTHISAPGFAGWQLDQRFKRLQRGLSKYERPGATRYAYERGRRTRRLIYENARRRLFSAGGRRFRTTNLEIVTALELAEHPRCDRTVRRAHRDLEAMGVLSVRHIVKSGPARRPGELDCLEICLRRGCVRPPLRGASRAGSKAGRPAQSVENDLSPPTSSAERAPPDGGNDQNGANEGAETDGFVPSPETLAYLRARLESLQADIARAQSSGTTNPDVPTDV